MSKGLDALKHIGEYHIGEKKYGYDIKETRVYGIVEQELEQYKVIEEEFGIGLETYFKALNNGAWYKDTSGNICWCDMPKFSKGDIDFNGYHTTTRMYGVIWALNREELE